MERKLSVVELPVNTSPEADHRRQMIWQVWVPVIASAVIVLAVAIWAIVGTIQGSSAVNHWGNISAVWVIMPVLFAGILLLGVTVAIIYGLSKLLNKMPGWMITARTKVASLAVSVRRAADSATQPVMTVNANTARLRAFWNKVFKGNKR
jgi:hypothetical protein